MARFGRRTRPNDQMIFMVRLGRIVMSAGPSERWKNIAENHAKICKGILKLSDSVRYVGALNRYGRTLAGFIRPGTKPMLGREQAKNEFFVLSAILRMSTETAAHIGKLEHILIRHEAVKLVLIPRGEVAYIVTIDGAEPKYMQIVEDVKQHLSI